MSIQSNWKQIGLRRVLVDKLKNLLSITQSNKNVSRKNCRDSNGSAEVRQRFNVKTIVRRCGTERPNKIWDEEHDERLIKPIEHVGPEFRAAILETANAPLV